MSSFLADPLLSKLLVFSWKITGHDLLPSEVWIVLAFSTGTGLWNSVDITGEELKYDIIVFIPRQHSVPPISHIYVFEYDTIWSRAILNLTYCIHTYGIWSCWDLFSVMICNGDDMLGSHRKMYVSLYAEYSVSMSWISSLSSLWYNNIKKIIKKGKPY